MYEYKLTKLTDQSYDINDNKYLCHMHDQLLQRTSHTGDENKDNTSSSAMDTVLLHF